MKKEKKIKNRYPLSSNNTNQLIKTYYLGCKEAHAKYNTPKGKMQLIVTLEGYYPYDMTEEEVDKELTQYELIQYEKEWNERLDIFNII